MSESSWSALAKGKERDWWSIDLEGEVEKLKVRGPWSVTEGDSVEPEERLGHKSDRTKVARVEKEKLKEDEMEVDVDASQGESVETQKFKKGAVRYWQFASVEVEEGGEAHTINLCQHCYNEQVVQQGNSRLNSWQWRAVVEKKHIVGECGKLWEMRNLYVECGSISLSNW